MRPVTRQGPEPRRRATRIPRNLKGLLTMSLDARAGIKKISRFLGKPYRSAAYNRYYTFDAPLPGVKNVEVWYAWRQNREYLTRVEIRFVKAALPTVRALAKALGVEAQLNQARVRATCTHGRCLSTSFIHHHPGRRDEVRLWMSVADRGIASVYGPSKDVGRLAVKALSFDAIGFSCPVGMPLANKVAFRAPSTARQKRLAALVRAAAMELVRARSSKEHLAQAIGATVKRRDFETFTLTPTSPAVRALFAASSPPWYTHNTLSKYTWLKMPLYNRKIPPMSFPGLRYVTDRKALCTLSWHERHLFEVPSTSNYSVRLVVQINRVGPQKIPYLDYLTLVRSPPRR